MENITTYYARRTNVFAWLSALLMLASAVARIAYFGGAEPVSASVVVVRIILPLAANLIFVYQLLVKGERQFCVTVWPVILLAIVMIADARAYGINFAVTTACTFFCILFGFMYFLTFSGHIAIKFPILLCLVIPGVMFAIDANFRTELLIIGLYGSRILISDLCVLLSLLAAVLAAKKMPQWKEGDPERYRLGDRIDGRKIRTLYPLERVAGYIMPNRTGASNYIRDYVETTNMEKYIHQKRREGYKHFGITHVFIAAYVRCCAELPAVNRFFSGQKIYARPDIEVCMAIKKELSTEGFETVIKTVFDKSDTAADVYRKYDEQVQSVKNPSLDSNFDNFAKLLNYIPGLFLKFTIWLIKVIDYFGMLPRIATKLSPFHGSMFITSMGSLGIPPIYHHLYDLGNIPVFCAFGAKRTEKVREADGSETVHRYVDFTWVTDERICDGYYYSLVLKRMKSLFLHPEQLDEPPEKIVRDID